MLAKLNADNPKINKKRSATLRKTFAKPEVKENFMRAISTPEYREKQKAAKAKRKAS
jgi:hypothetical protein